MTNTATLSSYQKIGSLANYFVFPNSNKSVSTYKKVIEITTDKKSTVASKKLLDFLNDNVIPNLPTTKKDFDLNTTKLQLENIKENQLKINKMFETIDNLFDSGDDVSIDDTNMLNLLMNMNKVKEKLSFIYDYLSLAIEVTEADIDNKKNGKPYSIDEFVKLLIPAA